jgi:hypothetical protein
MAELPAYHRNPRTAEGLVLAYLAGDSVWNEARREPEVAWQAIVQLSRRKLTDRQAGLLAAGPLEDLLSYHGPTFIERVVTEARVYPAFRQILGGVDPNAVDDSVLRRMITILNTPR